MIKIWNCSWASTKVAVFFCPSFLITNSNIKLNMFCFWFCCYKSLIIVKRCPNSWIDQRWVLIFIFSIIFFRPSISNQCNPLTMLLKEDAFKVLLHLVVLYSSSTFTVHYCEIHSFFYKNANVTLLNKHYKYILKVFCQSTKK